MKKSWALFITMSTFGFSSGVSALECEFGGVSRGWGLDLISTQQEVFGSGIELYSPGQAQWGQFGIGFANKDYYWTNVDNQQEKMTNGEVALLWKMGDTAVGRLVPLAIIQLGQSYYKTGTVENSKKKSHGFFALEFYAEHRLAPLRTAILRGLAVAIGVGSRSNFISNVERTVGNHRIAPNVIYPSFRVEVEF